MDFRRVVRIVAFVFLLGLCCVARSEERSVEGLVTDKAGNALPKAVVQLENQRTLSIKSFVTGNDGRYHFAKLNADIDYTLRAHYRKEWSKAKTLSEYSSGARLHIDLVIQID